MQKPNILFILADDMGAWAMGCSGNTDIITPNLDSLAKGGIKCDNFYCASPVCSPARASILTGTIPSTHGVHDYIAKGNLAEEKLNGKPMPPQQYISHLTAYTELLKANGYKCGLSGKWHLGDSITPQKGMDNWYTIGRGGCNYKSPDIVENGKVGIQNEYVSDLITKNAINNLKEYAKQDTPFYLGVHYTAPHSPWGKAQHKERIWDMYEGCNFNATPDLPFHPLMTLSAPFGKGEKRKNLLRGYYTAITAMDENIGQILHELKELNLSENTIVIFTSDNGMNMGHHGLFGKGNATYPQNLYDSSTKVPFIINYKNIAKPFTANSLYSHYDIMPTLVDYLDLQGDVTQHLCGTSFADVLNGNKECERPIFISGEYGMSRMVRSVNYKLIMREAGFPDEFYDLSIDKEETTNLINDKKYKEQIAIMAQYLNDFFAQNTLADYSVKGLKVSGLGQNCTVPYSKKLAFAKLVAYRNPLRAMIFRYKTKHKKLAMLQV